MRQLNSANEEVERRGNRKENYWAELGPAGQH